METPLSAVDLAEKYNYPALVRAVQLQPLLAHDVDDFGMTPLHWVCSDPLVPLRVLQKLVLVHPPATATKNLAGLLPLHIALRKDLPLDALKLLLKFYPKAITVTTPDGRTPLELANEHVRASSTKLFLQMIDAEVRALSRAASAAKKTTAASSQKDQQLRAAEYSSSSNTSSQSNQGDLDLEPHTPREQAKPAPLPLPPSPTYRDPITAFLSSPSMRAAAQQQRPPAWKLAKRCHICECKFGYFKSRHHCRNCGESVCSRHSRHSLPLRHIGLFHPQRVCAVCHEDLQNTRAGCNTNEASRSRGVSNASSRYSPTSEAYSAYRDGDDDDENASQRSSHRSLFWTPEAISPRLFNVPSMPPKRSKSVRNYLLGASPRHQPNSPRADLAAAAAASPSARSVRSESLQRNYSHATLSTLPMSPSASSMFLTRVQLAPAPSQLVKPPRHDRKDASRRRSSSRANEPPSTDSAQSRRLAKTDLDAPSKAWYEELDQLPHATSQKLSMDSRVSELEDHVQKLLVAKQQIRDALEKSQRQIHLARAEKDKYDAIAQKYLDAGYAELSPPAADSPLQASGSKDTEAPKAHEPVGSSSTVPSSPTAVDNNNSSSCEQDLTDSTESDRDGTERSTVSDATWSNSVRPSSPAPQLSPFRSEQLELHIPLDVAATQHELGVVLLSKSDFASAADAFRSALDIDSDNAVAWYHLAKALDGAGDAAAAEHAVNKSLALDSESLASLSLLGRLLHLRGEHDDAIVVFRKALKLQCPSGSDS